MRWYAPLSCFWDSTSRFSLSSWASWPSCWESFLRARSAQVRPKVINICRVPSKLPTSKKKVVGRTWESVRSKCRRVRGDDGLNGKCADQREKQVLGCYAALATKVRTRSMEGLEVSLESARDEGSLTKVAERRMAVAQRRVVLCIEGKGVDESEKVGTCGFHAFFMGSLLWR